MAADCAPCLDGQVKSPDNDYTQDAVCVDGREVRVEDKQAVAFWHLALVWLRRAAGCA